MRCGCPGRRLQKDGLGIGLVNLVLDDLNLAPSQALA
jgi:hypothetical protein